MAGKSVAHRHFQRALAQWPIDILRPQVSFQHVMRRRIDKQLEPSTPDKSTYDPAKESKDTLVTSLKPYDEQAQLAQVNALYSFMENRYSKKYPLSDRLLKPLSNPGYYENLMKELDEAPKRSFFGRLLNSWKGKATSSPTLTLSTHHFDGLNVNFEKPPENYGTFSSEQLALGFIAALAEESTRDSNVALPFYSFTYTDFPHIARDPLTIRMNFLGHNPAESKRSNVNYALVAIPNALLAKESLILGTNFWENRRGFATYSGAFGKLPTRWNAKNNATIDRSTLLRGRQFSISPFVDVPFLLPPSNHKYRFTVDRTGGPISKTEIFLSSLIYLLELGETDTEAFVTQAAFHAPSSPVWFYARGGPRNPSFPMKSISGIVKIIATQLVTVGQYQELTWSVRWGRDRVVMEGCVCKQPPRASMMCQGVQLSPSVRIGAGMPSS
ncbi:MAG: hypothetical protein Q9205_001222 [Flavoplaca limonia]